MPLAIALPPLVGAIDWKPLCARSATLPIRDCPLPIRDRYAIRMRLLPFGEPVRIHGFEPLDLRFPPKPAHSFPPCARDAQSKLLIAEQFLDRPSHRFNVIEVTDKSLDAVAKLGSEPGRRSHRRATAGKRFRERHAKTFILSWEEENFGPCHCFGKLVSAHSIIDPNSTVKGRGKASQDRLLLPAGIDVKAKLLISCQHCSHDGGDLFDSFAGY